MNLLMEPAFLIGLAIANLFAFALWLAARSRVVLRRRRVVDAPATSPELEDHSLPAPSTSALDGVDSRGEADLAARVARWRKRSEAPLNGRALEEWIRETERAEQASRSHSVSR